MKRLPFYSLIVSMFFFQAYTAKGTTGLDAFSIHSVGHGSLYFEYQNLVIHVDPYSAQANYSTLPDADIILITHEHQDHYDLTAINAIKKESTIMVFTQAVKALGTYTDSSIVMKNGDSIVVKGIPVKAVPAYNVINTSYHPKGKGNGYILTFGEKRIYIAGDTESIPEMDSLGTIDIAFLPMNLPYTMTPEKAAEAAKKVKPDILYIYHFGTSDTAKLRTLLSDQKMEIRMGKSVYYESIIRQPDKHSSIKGAITKKIAFHPNPVKDKLTITGLDKNSILSLLSMPGQEVLLKKMSYEGSLVLDLSFIKSGYYILNLQNSDSRKSTLVLKE
jgi:L-ascorbate metabolism protein UlaG (beta-lactamase superfamily)